jgi:hypothetical protein
MESIQTQALRVGILLHSTHFSADDKHAAAALAHCVSFCHLAALTILHPSSDTNTMAMDAHTWLGTSAKATATNQWLVHAGPEGLARMLANLAIDAVYVILPMQDVHTHVLQCLRARKHVLIRDFGSTPMADFEQQVAVAREHGRLVQFSTMFDMQYTTRAFLHAVQEHLGKIDGLSAELDVCPVDLALVGASLPLKASDSCIHRLARYCLLMGLLLTSDSSARPVTALIDHVVRSSDDDDGIPVVAKGRVLFDPPFCVTFSVSYGGVRTRQRLQVESSEKQHQYAVLTDFALPTPKHGLHSFRLYNQEKIGSTGKLAIVSGEAMDMATGLPSAVTMWRSFSQLSQDVQSSADGSSDSARALTQIAIYLKATMAALEEAARSPGQAVIIAPIR